MTPRARILLPLLGVLLLAAFTRTYHLTQQSLWLDEGYTYQVATTLDPIGAALDDMHPPLYYLLLAVWLPLTGDSVLAMRYISTLCAMLTVPLVYRLALRLAPRDAVLSPRRVALIATLLFALADADSFMAQEMRMYALHKLTLVLAVLLYLRWLARPTRRRWALWVAGMVAMLYTYYLSGLLLVAMALHAILFRRGRGTRPALGGVIIAGALFLPWAATGLLDQLRTPNPLFIPASLNVDVWREFLRLYFSGQWALVIALMLLGALGGAGTFRRWRLRLNDRAFLLLCWAAFPFLFIAGIGLVRPFFSPRWPFMVTPAIAILTAWGLARLPQPGRGALLAALVVFGVMTVDFYRPKPPWDDFAALTATYAMPGDVVLMEVGNGDFPLGYYLEHALPPDADLRSLRTWREATDDAGYDRDLHDYLADPDRDTVWVALWGAEADIYRVLAESGFQQTYETHMRHVDNLWTVTRWDRLPDDPVIGFEAGLTLRQIAIYPDRMRVDLWWSAADALPVDYTTSAFLLGEAGVAAQHDGTPQNGSRPTTSWMPGEVIYDPHLMQPADLPPGEFALGVQVYTLPDGTKVPTTAGDPWYTAGTVTLPVP